jgi:hypothetical protein
VLGPASPQRLRMTVKEPKRDFEAQADCIVLVHSFTVLYYRPWLEASQSSPVPPQRNSRGPAATKFDLDIHPNVARARIYTTNHLKPLL